MDSSDINTSENTDEPVNKNIKLYKNMVTVELLPVDQLEQTKIKLPSKLAHIVNQTFLINTWNPITGKYVKKIWAFKLTKLGREKRDMVWEYYRYRGRKSVMETVKDLYYRNRKIVMFIHFDDPAQNRIELTQEMIDLIKQVEPPKIKKPKKPKKLKVPKIPETPNNFVT